MTDDTIAIGLCEGALEQLSHLATVSGCDVWSHEQATFGRQLESAKLARIVKAKERPAGDQKQPYFGIKITASGQRFLERSA
jgi:hypothetical protein